MVQRSLARAGYELVPHYLMHSIPLRNHLRELFEHFRICCALDVGAHFGEYAAFLRDIVGFEGRIISFEPVASHFQRLSERALADPLWEPMNMALGSARETKSIHVTRGSTFSSFHHPDRGSMEAFATDRQKESTQIDHTEQVKIERLDTLLPSLLPGKAPAGIYLKIDTQGFDLEVLRGATGVLERVSALQTEVAVKRFYEDSPDFETSIAEFRRHGFEVAGFFPLARARDFSAVEFDCTMVNTRIPVR